MNPIRIFITGGTGFVGRSMLDALPAECDATVLTRHPEAHESGPRVHYIGGDIESFRFPGKGLDLILHLASPIAKPDPHRSVGVSPLYKSIVGGATHVGYGF